VREVPGSRFQVPGSRFQVPGSRFQVPGSRFQVPGSRFQVKNIVTGTWNLKLASSQFDLLLTFRYNGMRSGSSAVGSVQRLGRWGRRFKSCLPDQGNN
jgi:hypothetical protein